MTPSFTESTYNNTCKALSLATQVNAEQWLSLVQRQVACFLTDMAIDSAVTRLAKSDLAEMVLAQEALRLSQEPDYKNLVSLDDRQNFLQLVLAIHLFDWLALKVANPPQRALVESGAQYYVAKLIGTDNPA